LLPPAFSRAIHLCVIQGCNELLQSRHASVIALASQIRDFGHHIETMKPIEKNELYQHVNQFLKNKGVEVKEGTYAKQLEKSCGLLTDAINLTQKGMERAKTEIDKRLDQVRRAIHEKTAPKPFAEPPPQSAAAARNAVPPRITTREAIAANKRKNTKRKKSQSKARKSGNAKKSED